MKDNLLNIFEQYGEAGIYSGNTPIELNTGDFIWLVSSGSVNLFSTPLKNDKVSGKRNFICEAGNGDMFFELRQPENPESCFLASASPNTRLIKIDNNTLFENISDSAAGELSKKIDGFINRVSSGLLTTGKTFSRKGHVNKQDSAFTAGDEISVDDRILWASSDDASLLFLNQVHVELKGEFLFPLAPGTNSAVLSDTKIRFYETDEILQKNNFFGSLKEFLSVALKVDEISRKLYDKDVFDLYKATEESIARDIDESLLSLSEVIDNKGKRIKFKTPDGVKDNPLFIACQIIGSYSRIKIRANAELTSGKMLNDPLKVIAKASGIRYRRVILRDDWYKQDNGPLLAFTHDKNEPVALIPKSESRYTAVYPSTGRKEIVGFQQAESFEPEAFILYKSFEDKIINTTDVIKLGLTSVNKDVRRILALGMIVGILGLLVPMANQFIFNDVIPGANINQLMQISLILLSSALGIFLLDLVKAFGLLRFQGRMFAEVQLAFFDRLLKLPVNFFRRFSIGDLSDRVLGLNYVSTILNISTISLLITSVFGLINFFLLFYFSVKLAYLALLIVLAYLLVLYFVRKGILRFAMKMAEQRGIVSGVILQFLTAITKLKIAGAERRAFSKWAESFSVQKDHEFRSRSYSITMTVSQAIFQVASLIVIFIGMVYFNKKSGSMSLGSFIAFNTAFSLFIAAISQIVMVLIQVQDVIPVFKRVVPLQIEVPEDDENKVFPPKVQGNIEVNQVNFAYHKESPQVLFDISFKIKPGEFVAIVGPTGCGKTTLLRLLLGFEKPQTGSIYYDNMDIQNLDLQELRSQMGVVLQDSTVFPGTIKDNILGSAPLGMEAAWDAARKASCDKDIEAMPMGMHTMINEGGSVISGGQCQRILIARALAKKPNILFFDEATSALDNITQKNVMESIDGLKVNRIVIAHRLSTIINADTILVIDKGRIVQKGTYVSLMKEKGLFKEIAERQLI